MSASDEPALAPLITKLGLRSPLDPADIEMILALPQRIVKFEAGTYPVRQGDLAKNCCLVLSGYVCRSKLTGNGSRQIVSVQLKGDLPDLQNIILSEIDYNVQTLTDATIAFIPKQEFSDLAERRPMIRQALWLDILAEASISREWLVNIGRRNALERVSHLICELSIRQRMAEINQNNTYEWPMTQEQFGDAIGLTSVHINRMLKTLRDSGIITSSKRSITINDWPELKRVADFSQGYLQLPNCTSSIA